MTYLDAVRGKRLCIRASQEALTELYLGFWVVRPEAERHTLTEVHCPAGDNVYSVSVPVYERQPTATSIEISTPNGLHSTQQCFVLLVSVQLTQSL